MKRLIMIASMLLASLSYAASNEAVITATLEVIETLNVNFTSKELNFGKVVVVAGEYNTANTIDVTVTGASSSFSAYIQLPMYVDIMNIEGEKINVSTRVDNITNGTITSDGTNHTITSIGGVMPDMGATISGNMVLAGTELPGTYIGTMNVVAKYE